MIAGFSLFSSAILDEDGYDMPSLIELQAQIAALEKQASEIRARDFDMAVRSIRQQMQAFGITLKDLRASSVVARKKRPPVRAGKPYRGVPDRAPQRIAAQDMLQHAKEEFSAASHLSDGSHADGISMRKEAS